MELITVDNLPTLRLDLVMTLAVAAAVLVGGRWAQRGILARYSIPPPIIGGLAFALLVMFVRSRNWLGVTVDVSLRSPLQTIFFTTIGLGATINLLRAGGKKLPFFLLIASVTAVVQNAVGVALAAALGAPLQLGVVCGSLTLTGGPATGLAFAPAIEASGLSGARELIIASATFGIFAASLIGNPVATALIKRRRLVTAPAAGREAPAAEATPPAANDGPRSDSLLRSLCLILLIMGVGYLVSLALAALGVTLPGYIGAMVVAALVRYADDKRRWLKIDERAVEKVGAAALAFFLAVALMDLKLWQLAGLAVPMAVILAAQIVVTALYAAGVTFTLAGRDYEAAVTTSGHIGFALGITPNAVANMKALTEKYGPAPQSFLIVPVVGASFIDFTNSLVITASLKLLGAF